jgi:hypothetical protein
MAAIAWPEHGEAVAARTKGVPTVAFAAGLVTVTSAKAGAAQSSVKSKMEDEIFMNIDPSGVETHVDFPCRVRALENKLVGHCVQVSQECL